MVALSFVLTENTKLLKIPHGAVSRRFYYLYTYTVLDNIQSENVFGSNDVLMLLGSCFYKKKLNNG